MTLILGLGNKARHGKDSFAAAIDGHYALQAAVAGKHELKNYKPVVVQHHAFADALYKEVNQWLSQNPRWTYGNSGITTLADGNWTVIPEWVQPTENPEISARAPYGKHAKLLQWWGTEYRRAQDQNYWVNKWKAGINPRANIVLCTDMRFLNEAQAVRDAGGFTIQVSRLNLDGTPFVDPSRDANHPSETQLDGYNFDFKLSVKTGDLVLLEDWAITLVHYLRALKGHK
jgi:hypothetical protein